MNTETRKPYTVDSYKAGIKAICRNGQEPSEVYYFETARGSNYPIKAVCEGGIRGFLRMGDNIF